MAQIVGIVFILIAAWAVFSLRFGSGDDTAANPGLFSDAPPPNTSIYLAPVKCGPYFLYLHPAYYRLDRFHRRAQRYIVFSVSKTPPEAKVAQIEQLWAYGVSQNTIAINRPNLFGHEIHSRTAMRPAMMKEIGVGDYIGEYSCNPYRPTQLQCQDFSPWCDIKKTAPRQHVAPWVPPEFR